MPQCGILTKKGSKCQLQKPCRFHSKQDSSKPRVSASAKSDKQTFVEQNIEGFFSFRCKSMKGRKHVCVMRDVYIDLKKNTVDVLKKLAKAQGIPLFSKMKKKELVTSLNKIVKVKRNPNAVPL